MSGFNQQSQAPAPDPTDRVWSGWRKIATVTGVLGLTALSGFIYSGWLPSFGLFDGKQAQQDTPVYEADTRLTPLDRPSAIIPAPIPASRPLAISNPPKSASMEDWSEVQKASLASKMTFIGGGNSTQTGAPRQLSPEAAATVAGIREREAALSNMGAESDIFSHSIRPTTITASEMVELPSPRWMISQGRLMQCQQLTHFSSYIPGMVTGVISMDRGGMWSDTGDVLLIPNGSMAVGIMREVMLHGVDRVSLFWLQVTTPILYDKNNMPHHFRIGVESPFADALGTTGADVQVNHHWFPKIGAILGSAILQTGSAYAVARAQQNNTSNTTIDLGNVQNGMDTATNEFLRSIIEIPDEGVRNQGRECSVFLARDLIINKDYKHFLLERYGA
jgi:type IV secretory pathway VirB10-like protein